MVMLLKDMLEDIGCAVVDFAAPALETDREGAVAEALGGARHASTVRVPTQRRAPVGRLSAKGPELQKRFRQQELERVRRAAPA